MIPVAINLIAGLVGGKQFIAKIIFWAVIALALVTGYGIWHHHVWSNGYDRALVDIARQDNKAVTRARSYRDRVRECSAGGLRWDQSTGQCQRR